MDKLDLFILNNGTPTRRTRPHSSPSSLNLSICSPHLAPVLSWEVLQDSYDPISCANALSQTMLLVVDVMFPLRNHSVLGIPTPLWWDQECIGAVEERRGAEILCCRNIFQENFINFSKIGNVRITWKTQTIIPIFKNKGNPDDPTAYRPIAEHLVKNRLEWIAERRGLLTNSQYGFRKCRGIIDNLSIFASDIHVSFFQEKIVTAAFLDISFAYDNVLLSILRNKLHKLVMPVRLSNFTLIYFLKEEVFFVLVLRLKPHDWCGGAFLKDLY
ncbi:Probable RNA-directed DNA polymerase from transposon BS [Eumeta japonica]|uniref:Probable RNA-directed DNA polymerase from transposon BS n=1 Tax=Eumeta variegata TaxID=151549 RepID=A0A4C1WTP8_EUMVA|nr:Probable RNA-directed DNA polymerase from transposon BS [Eumeta japonica]